MRAADYQPVEIEHRKKLKIIASAIWSAANFPQRAAHARDVL
jgi:hypothetical protein